MENEERINEYIKQCCSNCKNKSNCKIKVFETEDIIYTKCENYQQEKKLEGYKRPIVKTAGRKLEIWNGQNKNVKKKDLSIGVQKII